MHIPAGRLILRTSRPKMCLGRGAKDDAAEDADADADADKVALVDTKLVLR